MRTYLGLGSNLGDRRANLTRAIELLAQRPLRVERVSPVVESPALLPDGAPPEWNRPYLNLAVACESEASPETLREWSKEIEQRLGRTPEPRWSPRPMDVDILLFGDEQVRTESLTIPHPVTITGSGRHRCGRLGTWPSPARTISELLLPPNPKLLTMMTSGRPSRGPPRT